VQDIAFFRELLYDGRFDDIELLVEALQSSPLPSSHAFDAKEVLFHVRRQRFLELFSGKVVSSDTPELESDSSGAEGRPGEVTVMGLVDALRGVELVAPNKQAFNSLCYCLTLTSVNEHPEFSDWTMFLGRHRCFLSVKDHLSRAFPGDTFDSKHTHATPGTAEPHRYERLLVQAAASDVAVRVCADPRLSPLVSSPLSFDPTDAVNGVHLTPNASILPGAHDNTSTSSRNIQGTSIMRPSSAGRRRSLTDRRPSAASDALTGLALTSDQGINDLLQLWYNAKPVVNPLPYAIPVPADKFMTCGNETSMRASASNLSMTLGRMRRSMGQTQKSLRYAPQSPAVVMRASDAPRDATMRATLASIPLPPASYPSNREDKDPESKQDQVTLDDRLSRSIAALTGPRFQATPAKRPITQSTQADHTGMFSPNQTVAGREMNVTADMRFASGRPSSSLSSSHDNTMPSLTTNELAAVRALLRQSLRMESPAKVRQSTLQSVEENESVPTSQDLSASHFPVSRDMQPARERRRSAVKWEVPLHGAPSRPTTADALRGEERGDSSHLSTAEDDDASGQRDARGTADGGVRSSSSAPGTYESQSNAARSKWMGINIPSDTQNSSVRSSAASAVLASPYRDSHVQLTPRTDRVAALLGAYDKETDVGPSVHSSWLQASVAPLKDLVSPMGTNAAGMSGSAAAVVGAMTLQASPISTHVKSGRVSSPPSSSKRRSKSPRTTPSSPPPNTAPAVVQKETFSKQGHIPPWLESALHAAGAIESLVSEGYTTPDCVPSLSVAPVAVYRDTQPIRALAFSPECTPCSDASLSDSLLFVGTNSKALHAFHAPSTATFEAEHVDLGTGYDTHLGVPLLRRTHTWSGHHLGSIYCMSAAAVTSTDKVLIATGSNDTTIKIATWNSTQPGLEDAYQHLGRAATTPAVSITTMMGTIRDVTWVGPKVAPTTAGSPTMAHPFSSTPMIAACGGGDYAVRLYDVSTSGGSGVRPAAVSLVGHTDTVHSIRPWSADGKQLVSCSADGSVRLWDARMRKSAASFFLSSSSSPASIRPAGSLLPTSSLATSPSGIELHSLSVRESLTPHFMPRELVIGCGDGTVAIIDLLASRMIASARIHTEEVRSIDSLGPLLLSASFDASIAISAVTTTGLVPTGEAGVCGDISMALTRTDHTDKTLCGRWHPFANMFATSSADKSVIMWNIKSN
jgi:WD40 repeat protein